MSFFANATSDQSVKNETDSLGGRVLDTNIYLATVAMAYGVESAGGALGLALTFKTESGDTLEETLYVTSGKEKGQKNYTERDGVKQYLPGYNQATALCLLTTGKELADMAAEEKQVQIYNSKEKKKVATKVQVLTELIGKKVYIAVEKQTVWKQKDDGTGKWVDTNETREKNEIVKMFSEKDKRSTSEIREKKETPEFFEAWLERWKGQTRNKAKGSPEGGATAGAPKTGGASNAKPTQSLFGS